MATFTRTWNPAYEALPPDTENAKNGAERINETKVDTRERLEIDHSMAGDVDDGLHLKVSFVDPLAAKPTQVNDETYLYSKDVAGTSELFFEDEVGNEIQLTSGGSLGLVGQVILGDLTGAVTGNADTATAWATGRTLTLSGDLTGNTGAFDGSGAISLNAQIAANAVGAAEIAAGAVGQSELAASACRFASEMTIGTTSGSASVSSSATLTLARGVWGYYTASANIRLEYFINGAWRAGPAQTHGQIVSDGATIRIGSSSGAGATVFYDETYD